MKCATVKVGGVTAIVCGSPKRPKKCAKCRTKPGTRLCDWRLGLSGYTCDVPLCEDCTHSPAPKKDLCPAHVEEFKQWQAAKAARAK